MRRGFGSRLAVIELACACKNSCTPTRPVSQKAAKVLQCVIGALETFSRNVERSSTKAVVLLVCEACTWVEPNEPLRLALTPFHCVRDEWYSLVRIRSIISRQDVRSTSW